MKAMKSRYLKKVTLTSREHGEIECLPTPNAPCNDHEAVSFRASGKFGSFLLHSILETEDYSLWQNCYLMDEDSCVTMSIDKPYLGIHFLLKNDMHYKIEGFAETVVLEHQYNIFYVPSLKCEYPLKKGKEYISFDICFTPEYLQWWKDSFPHVSRFLGRVMHKTPVMICKKPLTVTPEMMAIILSILRCPYTGSLRKTYIEIKVSELILISLRNTSVSSFEEGPKVILREQDLKKIQEAREYLLEHMDDPGTLVNLAHRVGINDFKLKNGFKQIYGATVFGFLLEERMQKALELIVETDMPIQKIAVTIGYQNLSGFSAAFRRRFGYPPSILRRGLASQLTFR